MPYRYMPMLRSKAGEVRALEQLVPVAKQRIFPVMHLVAKVPVTFIPKIAQAWPQSPIALDGLFNFNATGASTDFSATFNALRHAGLSVVPSIECDSDPRYVTAAKKFVTRGHPSLVVKVSLAHLSSVQSWVASHGWDDGNIDLIILAGHIPDLYSDLFVKFLETTLANSVPGVLAWRSITLSSSAAPKDYSRLSLGRNVVPRADWLLWKGVYGKLGYGLNYSDYGISHHDLTEPPGVAMAKASVSVRYAVDDDWIVWKGNATTGASGKPMDQQYRAHAKKLYADAQFNNLPGCWGDQRITDIATQPKTSSGSRTSWVEIGVNRHLSLVADRLP